MVGVCRTRVSKGHGWRDNAITKRRAMVASLVYRAEQQGVTSYAGAFNLRRPRQSTDLLFTYILHGRERLPTEHTRSD